MLKLVAIVLLLGGFAAFAEACCMPKQWESIIGITNTSVIMGKLDVQNIGFMEAYDFHLKKRAFIAENYKIVEDYNKMMEYFISRESCTTAKLSRGMFNCIPDNVTSEFNYWMGGTSSSGVILEAYNIEDLAPDTGFKGYFTINPDGCIPFGESILRDQNYMTIGFLNFTMGIQDPSVFDVPSPPCPMDTDMVNSLKKEHDLPRILSFV